MYAPGKRTRYDDGLTGDVFNPMRPIYNQYVDHNSQIEYGDNLEHYKVKQLKAVLKELKQKVGGNKAALIERIRACCNGNVATINSAVENGLRQMENVALKPSTFHPEVIEMLKAVDPFAEHISTLVSPRMITNYQSVLFDVGINLIGKLERQRQHGMYGDATDAKYAIQVRCVQQNTALLDKISKVEWPQATTVEINSAQVVIVQAQPNGATKRSSSINEKPADITRYVKANQNVLAIGAMQTVDLKYIFTIDFVRIIPPKEHMETVKKYQRVPFEDGKQRVKAMFHADDDIVTTSMVIRLKCPIGLIPINIPARGKDCVHAQCFDLETFLTFQESAKNASWKCPTCNMKLNVKDLVVDEWFEHLINDTKNVNDIDRVEIQEDGTWQSTDGKKANNDQVKTESNENTNGKPSHEEINLASDDEEDLDAEENKAFEKMKRNTNPPPQIAMHNPNQPIGLGYPHILLHEPAYANHMQPNNLEFPMISIQPNVRVQQGLSLDDAIDISSDDGL